MLSKLENLEFHNVILLIFSSETAGTLYGPAAEQSKYENSRTVFPSVILDPLQGMTSSHRIALST